MKSALLVLAGMLIAALLKSALGHFWSFRAQSPFDYQNERPTIDIPKHLGGSMIAEGVVFDFTGRAGSRFTGIMQGDWQGNSGTLKETFTFNSGTVQNRRWALQVDRFGKITGTASDIIGTANGHQVGPVAMLEYKLKLPDSAGGHVIDVTDWMYLTANGAIMNKAEFRKFGIKVGEMLATFRPVK